MKKITEAELLKQYKVEVQEVRSFAEAQRLFRRYERKLAKLKEEQE